MIDVFMRVMSTDDALRKAMQIVACQRWWLELVHLDIIQNYGIREGREYAEKQAQSDPYIYTDNDVLIVGKDWVKRGTEAMLAHPEFKVCSSLSLVEGENMAKPPQSMAFEDFSLDALNGKPASIYEMHAVGAPMWIRKGILTNLPELTLDQECGRIHKLVLDLGYKEGLINGLRHNHLGHGFSSNPALHWGF